MFTTGQFIVVLLECTAIAAAIVLVLVGGFVLAERLVRAHGGRFAPRVALNRHFHHPFHVRLHSGRPAH